MATVKSNSPALQGSVLVAGVGAFQGLGAAIARRFGREGFPVVIAGRNEEKLQATRSLLEAEGIDVRAVCGSVTEPTDVKRFIEAAIDMAPLAVAVHNAGGNNPAPFLQVNVEEFEAHWREHVLGAFHLAQAALPALLARYDKDAPSSQCGGSLLFSGASGSLRGKARFASFSAAKGALRNLAQSLAREFGPQGVHVAHVVIDGGIGGERFLARVPDAQQRRGPDGLLNIDAIAEAYWVLHNQHRSAWTQELDLRPWSENF
ncbi:SDR family NAD(P)-dependent oxidoreductase [Burkholderia multivorans]|uniref:SDR family NAD(P)-dependent oxidoreductase n=1 Tax=Burkholderia multivorans TaxID=87883 RepID=UPI001C22ACA3|nr:SDR family NAD(P)-dependent oxidoreductase [Burkholderia multivorans]MBU9480690.1 SDR family NAD(P)-dependent oxidoreductase [Burkholderia multivorans]